MLERVKKTAQCAPVDSKANDSAGRAREAGIIEGIKRRKNLEQTTEAILPFSRTHKLSLTFLWYRLNPDSAAATEEQEVDDDVLAVSDDAPRRARSKDCDRMV